jgi:hypothetical protein
VRHDSLSPTILAVRSPAAATVLRPTKYQPGELLAPAAAELVRRLAAEAAESVLELAREAAHLWCSFFADLMGDLPYVVDRPFSSLVPSG